MDYCHLVILNIFPNNIESQVTSQGPREVSSSLIHKCAFVKRANEIIFKIVSLVGFTIANGGSAFHQSSCIAFKAVSFNFISLRFG